MPHRKQLPRPKFVNVPSSSGQPDSLTSPSTAPPGGSNSNLQVQLPDRAAREEGFELEHVEDVALENAQGSVKQPILENDGVREEQEESASTGGKGKGRELPESAGESSRPVSTMSERLNPSRDPATGRFIRIAQGSIRQSTLEGVPGSSRQSIVEVYETPVGDQGGPSAEAKGKGRAVNDDIDENRRYNSTESNSTIPRSAQRLPLSMPPQLRESLRVKDALAAKNASSQQEHSTSGVPPPRVGHSSTSKAGTAPQPRFNGRRYAEMSEIERIFMLDIPWRQNEAPDTRQRRDFENRYAVRNTEGVHATPEMVFRQPVGARGLVSALPVLPSVVYTAPESPEEARSFAGFNASVPAYNRSPNPMGSFRLPGVGSSGQASAASRAPAGAPTGPRALEGQSVRPTRPDRTEAFHNASITAADFNVRLREVATAERDVQSGQSASPAHMPNTPGDRVRILIRRAQSPHRELTRLQGGDSVFMYPEHDEPMNLSPALAPARGWQRVNTSRDGGPQWIQSDCTEQYWPHLEGESPVDGNGDRIRIGLPHSYVPRLRAPGDNDDFDPQHSERQALCTAPEAAPIPAEQAYSVQTATAQAPTLAAPQGPVPPQTSMAVPSSSQAESSTQSQGQAFRPRSQQRPRKWDASKNGNWRQRKDDGADK